MKAFLLSAVALAVVSATDIIQPDPTRLYATKEEIAKQVAFTSAATKGLVSGYMKGMYKNTNYRPQDRCLDTETQGYFTDFLSIWTPAASDTTWGTAIVSLQKGLLQVSDWCEIDEAVYGYLTFCYNSEQCNPTYMIGAIMKKVFQLTTVANDFAQIFMEGIPKVTDAASVVQTFFDRIGTNMGKLLRYAVDFDPTLYPIIA